MVSLPVLFSCAKQEGFGGNSHIKGTLMEKVYNDDYSLLLYEQPAVDKDVFIVFGDDDFVGDDTKTDYQGRFQFSYLLKGTYSIYYYSDDTTSAYGENTEILQTVDLGKKETIDLGEMVRVKTLDYNEGNATIKGQVYLINYMSNGTVVKDTSLAQEKNVYIVYGIHTFYDDRIDTNFDGTCCFSNLIKGNYQIFLYSEDITGATQDIVVSREVEVIEESQTIDLGNIYIEQL